MSASHVNTIRITKLKIYSHIAEEFNLCLSMPESAFKNKNFSNDHSTITCSRLSISFIIIYYNITYIQLIVYARHE